MSVTAATAATQVGLSAINAIADRYSLMTSGGSKESLVQFTQAARVEPTVLVDTDVLFLDELHDVQQSLLSMFAGYYLQAVALNSTVGNAKVLSTLEKFQPNRDLDTAKSQFMGHLAGLALAKESFTHRLPGYRLASVSLEAEGGNTSRQVDPDDAERDRDHKRWKQDRERTQAGRDDKVREADEEDRLKDRTFKNERQEREASERAREDAERSRVVASYGKDSLSTLKENVNLSLGKMIEVTLRHNDQTFTLPISIRLIANTIPSAKLVHILSLANEETSASERYHGWRSGRLSFVKDLIFCRDLIDAHRKNLMANGDALYTNILAKERRNSLAAILSGTPSVAAASNMVVTSSNSIAELELSLNGKFNDFHTRQKVFEKTSLMIVAVIDKEWARVTFYTRGIPEATEVSFRDIKSSNKGSGPDVSDILKAYQLGHAPSL